MWLSRHCRIYRLSVGGCARWSHDGDIGHVRHVGHIGYVTHVTNVVNCGVIDVRIVDIGVVVRNVHTLIDNRWRAGNDCRSGSNRRRND